MLRATTLLALLCLNMGLSYETNVTFNKIPSSSSRIFTVRLDPSVGLQTLTTFYKTSRRGPFTGDLHPPNGPCQYLIQGYKYHGEDQLFGDGSFFEFQGMQCSYGHKNVLSEILDSCPGILDSSDKSYCCVDIENNRMYCCDAAEFMMKTTWLLLTVIAAAVIGVSLIVCCISCLCCSCCPWYRRRHRGTVYGKVQVPTVVHVIQSPASVPQSTQPHVTAMNATSSAGMSQPPPYAEVVYEKQAAYNPTYVTSNQQ